MSIFYKPNVDIKFEHLSIGNKLPKPKELKNVKSFSVDYIPKKCKCQVFILNNDVYVKHNDYFSPSLRTPNDKGTPLSYRIKKYFNQDRRERFLYPDTWGDIVLRQRAWLKITNLYKTIKSDIFVLDIKHELLKQQEKVCNFNEYELFTGSMERMWEKIINTIKKDYNDSNIR